MPADISADLAYLGGVWAEGVLYGNNLNFFKWYNSVDLLLSRYPVSLDLSLKHNPWSVCTRQVSLYSSRYSTFSLAALTLEEEKNHLSKSESIYIPLYILTRQRFRIRILLAYATVMFILSTTHVALAISELVQGFVFERESSTPGGPAVFFRINVFPKRKAIYIVNVRVFILFCPCECLLFIFNFLCDLDASRRFPLGTSFVILFIDMAC